VSSLLEHRDDTVHEELSSQKPGTKMTFMAGRLSPHEGHGFTRPTTLAGCDDKHARGG